MKLALLFEVNEMRNRYSSFSELTDQDLYDIAVWGIMGDFAETGCWDFEDKSKLISWTSGDYRMNNSEIPKEVTDCVVNDFKNYLNNPYPKNLGNVPENPIMYRLVRLKNIESLNKANLGISWFANPTQYQESGFFEMLDYLKTRRTEQGDVYILKGQTHISNIDIPSTLWHRTTQWWENEMVVKDDTKIKLLEIKKL